MDRPSSISSSSCARAPLGALFACVLLLAGEIATRALFKPPYVSLASYTRYYPQAYQYGFEGARACFRMGRDMSCAPTQDMNVIPQTFPRQKPPGELRIIVIGASISWEGSRAGASAGNYPNRTVALLERAHPERPLRLINLSVPGFGSTRQALRFREALEYGADLFIVHAHDTNEIKEERRRAYVRGLHSGLAGKLLYSSAVVVLKERWSSLLAAPAPAAVVTDSEDESAGLDRAAKRAGWEANLERNVQSMLDLAKARSIPVILVGSSRSDVADLCGGTGRVLNAFLASRVSDQVRFLDVPALFRAETAHKKRRLFRDKVHYSPEGAQLVAAALSPLTEAALPALGPGVLP